MFTLKIKSNLCKRLWFSLLITLAFTLPGFSQAGISSTGALPNNAAGLDVNFSDKGLLTPRVALTSTTSSTPLSGHVAGMLVYNTATTGDVVPSFYYDDGTKWIQVLPSSTAAGDMQYWDGTAWVSIPAGTTGQRLQINSSGVPAWVTTGVATITTTAVTAVTTTTATSGGTISNDGGFPITAYGVCWSTTPAPTIANSLTSNGAGIGTYTSSITGLTTGTLYYLRAYATNSAGTAYGLEISFTSN